MAGSGGRYISYTRLYHHLSLPSIKETLVAVATVKPHSGSSSSKTQNFSKTLAYNTVLPQPKDTFSGTFVLFKKKEALQGADKSFAGLLLQGTLPQRQLPENLKILYFFPLPLPLPTPPPSFSVLQRMLLHTAYSITTSSSIKQNAYTSVRCHSLSRSFPLMGKARAMGTSSHNTCVATSLGQERQRHVSYPAPKETTPLHNHCFHSFLGDACSVTTENKPSLNWLKFSSTGHIWIGYKQTKKRRLETTGIKRDALRKLCQKQDKSHTTEENLMRKRKYIPPLCAACQY